MKVWLDVPDGIDFQLIFRLERKSQLQPAFPDNFRFVFLNSVRDGLKSFDIISATFGTLAVLKTIAKLATPTRSMYLVCHEERVVSYGWCSRGWCKYYKVEPSSVVIGPIWSDAHVRGRGLATFALQKAIDEHVGLGHNVFYIDTTGANVSAQRVFEKAGFTQPCALHFLGTRTTVPKSRNSDVINANNQPVQFN